VPETTTERESPGSGDDACSYGCADAGGDILGRVSETLSNARGLARENLRRQHRLAEGDVDGAVSGPNPLAKGRHAPNFPVAQPVAQNDRRRAPFSGALSIRFLFFEIWSRRTDLNRGPADYESAALPLSYAG
jgi:hypothetical protein